MHRRLGLVALLFFLLASPWARADQSPAQRLKELKQELEEKRKALRDLDNQEKSLIVAVGELDQSLAALAQQREVARERVAVLKRELASLHKELARDEARLAQVSQRLRTRLRALYVLGDGATVRAILGAQSFEDLSLRRRLLSSLTENDVRLLGEHARVRADVLEKKAALERKVKEAEETELQLKEQAELVDATRKERAAAIQRIDEEKELFVRAVKEIVEQQRALERLLKKVSTPRGRKLRGKGVLRDGLAWPVKGTLIRRFGVVREAGTGARLTSNGIHIRVPPGTPVAAAADGRIVHVGWLRGFGQIVIVDHGEGHHTLSAHLSRVLVKRGERVTRGQTLAFSGDTESLNGPKLYFELREEGRPKDPAPYLR